MLGGVPMSEAKKTATIIAVGGLLVFGILEGGEYIADKGGTIDAGVTQKCARKLPDSGCLRLTGYVGETPKPTDPGDYNQFQATEAVGDCEMIDCQTEIR